MKCIFCDTDSLKVTYQTDNVYVINDIKPQAKLHLLFISKKHFDSIIDAYKSSISQNIFNDVLEYLVKNKIDQFQLHINCGKKMGQVIGHLHIHILSN